MLSVNQNTAESFDNSSELNQLVAQLSEPQTAAALRHILQHADLLDALISGLDGTIRRGDTIAENIGASWREFGAATNGNGNDHHDSNLALATAEIPALLNNLPVLVKTGNKLSELAASKEFDELLKPEKLRVLNQLSAQLGRAETLEALTQIVDNAPLIAMLVTSVDGLLRRGDQITGNIGDLLREAAPQNSLDGEKLVAQLPELLKSLPKLVKAGTKLAELTDAPEFDDFLDKNNLATFKLLVGEVNKPETLASIAQIIQFAPVAAMLLSGINGFLERGETIMDNVAGALREAQPHINEKYLVEITSIAQQLPVMLPALMQRLPALMRTGARLAEITESPDVQAFLNSKMLSPQTIGFLGEVGEMVVETQENFHSNPKEVGIWGLYKAMNDADVQRGLGFVIELARNFGKMTEPSTSLVIKQ